MPLESQASPNTPVSPRRTVTQDDRPFQHRVVSYLSGKEREWISWKKSVWAIICSSWLNALLVFIPLAWVWHFLDKSHSVTFGFSFLAIIALEKLFDWCGEQLAMYCGPDLGDLIIITFNNIVEATLAVILLVRCELKLLQSTITGVVLLHLLLVPGTSFLTGGVRVWEQQLHPDRTQLNLTLLTIGVLALTVPAAFFAAIDTQSATEAGTTTVASDELRHQFLRISRGFALVLLVIYVCSRIYLHNPPGQKNASEDMPRPEITAEALRKERELAEREPKVNPVACIITLIITIGLIGATAEFLVDSIQFVQLESKIREEWFGIFLLPFASFSADGAVAIVFFVRSSLRQFLGTPESPDLLAQSRAIDLSIQFLLLWMPVVTLLGWAMNKPMTLLFDLFEVVLLVGACFLVNYVTADAKTNWAEGFILVSYYLMIALAAWYYPGQTSSRILSACESIVVASSNGVGQNN